MQPDTLPERASERNHGLDMVRGLAALGIAIYHGLYINHGTTIQSLGTFGVYSFFVVSGLTMMMVYGARFRSAIDYLNLKEFFWHRITRIMPLLVAVASFNFVVGIMLASLRGEAWHWPPGMIEAAAKMVLTGSGLFALHLPGFLSNTVGAWSLGIEILFYLLFPIICLAAMNCRIRAAVIALVILVAGQQFIMLLMQGTVSADLLKFWHYFTTPIVFAPFFALGILIFRWPLATSTRNFYCSIGLLLVVALFSLIITAELFEAHGWFLFLTAVAAGAVALAYRAMVPQRVVGLATVLGNASYSLYLTHWFTLLAWNKLCNAMAVPTTIATITFIPVALAVSYCCFVLFERPVQTFLRRRSAGQRKLLKVHPATHARRLDPREGRSDQAPRQIDRR